MMKPRNGWKGRGGVFGKSVGTDCITSPTCALPATFTRTDCTLSSRFVIDNLCPSTNVVRRSGYPTYTHTLADAETRACSAV